MHWFLVVFPVGVFLLYLRPCFCVRSQNNSTYGTLMVSIWYSTPRFEVPETAPFSPFVRFSIFIYWKDVVDVGGRVLLQHNTLRSGTRGLTPELLLAWHSARGALIVAFWIGRRRRRRVADENSPTCLLALAVEKRRRNSGGDERDSKPPTARWLRIY